MFLFAKVFVATCLILGSWSGLTLAALNYGKVGNVCFWKRAVKSAPEKTPLYQRLIPKFLRRK